jgi:hypothetical protein
MHIDGARGLHVPEVSGAELSGEFKIFEKAFALGRAEAVLKRGVIGAATGCAHWASGVVTKREDDGEKNRWMRVTICSLYSLQ